MGNFVGGMLKYLKTHPVPRVTVAGGFAKMSKLAGGRLDLHSKRGLAGIPLLAGWLRELGADEAMVQAALEAKTAQEILLLAGRADIPLADRVARLALREVRGVLSGTGIDADTLIVSRDGRIIGRAAE